jgi:hypothetical protein
MGGKGGRLCVCVCQGQRAMGERMPRERVSESDIQKGGTVCVCMCVCVCVCVYVCVCACARCSKLLYS